MLSSAHVLAMDAKTLLDVVDSVRIRYPEVNQIIRNSHPVEEVVGVPNPELKENVESSASTEVTSHYGLPNKVTEHITAT